MAEQLAQATGQLLSTREAAAWLGLSVSTLNKWRCYGTGPDFIKAGGNVRYSRAALEAYAAGRTRKHTRDGGPTA